VCVCVCGRTLCKWQDVIPVLLHKYEWLQGTGTLLVCECVREEKIESARSGTCLLAHFNDTVEEVVVSHTWDMLWRSVYQYILCCILPALSQ